MSNTDKIPPHSDGTPRSQEVTSSKSKSSEDTLSKKAILSQVMSMVSTMVDDLKQMGQSVNSAEKESSSDESSS